MFIKAVGSRGNPERRTISGCDKRDHIDYDSENNTIIERKVLLKL